jgi:exopolyphosphatase/guanosine-5'-triphosphate,3'-diphosphate pyrophosphatase
MAVVDMGSNAARLLVGELNEKQNIIQHSFIRVPIALGRYSYGKDGNVPEAAQAVMIDTLNGLRLLARSMKASHCRVVATAAVRDCENRQALQSVAFKQTGLRIEVLNGAEEAAIVGAFVSRKFSRASTVLNVDAGGGSTDCSIIVDGKIIVAASFDVGTARPRCGTVVEKKRLAVWLRRHTAERKLTAVASGGGARSLVDICGSITDDKLAYFIMAAQKMTPSKRATTFNLTLDKAHKIVSAARICQHVLQAVGVMELKTIQGGLGEAVLTEMLLTSGKCGALLT